MGRESNKYMRKNQSTVDWVTLRAQWEAGTPNAKLAENHGISTSRIGQVKRKEQWTRVLKNRVKASVSNGDAKENNGIKTIGKGRSIGQPMGEIGADTEALSQSHTVTDLSAPEQRAVLLQATTEIELMKTHRRLISRASVIAENILVRIHSLVVDGVASDVITFKTKTGEAYHRVPFLGDRESVSDALLKCANAISKLVPLERQAHGLTDASKDDKLPTIHFNMPNVKVISVDGRGKVVKAEEMPAQIEGQAADMTK